ncbi:MAG TPA: WbqC family protein [Kofleriaceae bacterium]|nr:WbqC family protein [Kofleriaceae bacterium]
MRLADIQPQYFPRLHYLARMLDSDVFVLRDDVQLVRTHRYPDGTRGVSYQVHTPIKAPQGVHLLGVSIRNGPLAPICEAAVSYDQPWARKHRSVLASFYANARHRRTLLPEIEALLAARFETVAALNIATTCWALARALGIAPRIPEDLTFERLAAIVEGERPGRLRRLGLGSRWLATCASKDPSERIVRLCELAGADEYVAGGTAFASYLDRGPFERAGIRIHVQQWTCPAYPQQFERTGHLANLSILDLLMNAPAERAATLLC